MKRLAVILTLLTMLLSACVIGAEPEPPLPTSIKDDPTLPTVAPTSPTTTTMPPTGRTIRLLTHDSFAISDSTLAAFSERTGLEVALIQAGDAGQMVNQALLAAGNPVADVIFGVDNTFLSRAVEGGLFEPYGSPLLDRVPDSFEAGPEVTPIDFGDVCLNYDIAALGDDPPATLEDLTDPRYSDMLVVESPATSSPGLAFLIATVQRFGESGEYTWKDYWADLVANGVKVAPGWTEAYFGDFTVAGEGDRPIVVSYASSPPAEVIIGGLDQAPSAVVTDGCFRQVEYAGVLRGSDNVPGAQMLIDFMLSETFQSDIPLNMFVFPVVEGIALPEEFSRYTEVVENLPLVSPELIETNRERWIEEWSEIVER